MAFIVGDLIIPTTLQIFVYYNYWPKSPDKRIGIVYMGLPKFFLL